jgi:hypothetical protein
MKKRTVEKGWVYFIWFNSELAYIGCTQNLEQRFSGHPVRRALQSFGQVDFTQIEFDEHFAALHFENKVIDRLNPPLNFRLGNGMIKSNDERYKSILFLLGSVGSFTAIEIILKRIGFIFRSNSINKILHCVPLK